MINYNKLGIKRKYVSKRLQAIALLGLESSQFIEELERRGYIALYHLCTEDVGFPLEFYTLVQSRDEETPKGYDIGHIPINSHEGKQIINRFLNQGDVMIYPDAWMI
jgi:hypothetical protein